jgi:hypothetical protein
MEDAYKSYFKFSRCNSPIIRRNCVINAAVRTKTLGGRFALTLRVICVLFANDLDEEVRLALAAPSVARKVITRAVTWKLPRRIAAVPEIGDSLTF